MKELQELIKSKQVHVAQLAEQVGVAESTIYRLLDAPTKQIVTLQKIRASLETAGHKIDVLGYPKNYRNEEEEYL